MNLLWFILTSFTFPLVVAQQLQYYYYYPYPQNQRQLYYPVRTNCQNRCIPQTRYRWTYRPMPMNVRVPYKPNINGVSGKFKPMPEPKPIVPYQTKSLPIYITTTPTTTTTDLPTPAPYTGTYPPAIHESSTSNNFLRPSKKPEIEYPTVGANRAINPCPEGKPLMNEFDNPMTCNFVVRPNGGCPEDYWCHTGSSYATTACCPIIKWEDKCQLERSNGEGADLIPRWFYDPLDAQCKRFLYKGLKGNSNNFITQIQCMEECGTGTSDPRSNAFINPCAVGVAARSPDNTIITCTPEDESVCGAGFYCHLAEKAGVCCERSSAEDRCRLPLAVGEGTSQLTRFYYNEAARKCLEFKYHGTKGNENQFATYADCKKTCMTALEFVNPCPTRGIDHGELKSCSPISNLCEKGEWCHISATEKTCCPGAVTNPCKLTLEFGEGEDNLTRWYSDPSDKSCNNQCKSFTYRGRNGNQNNFVSKELCEATCKTECTNPCSSGELLLNPSNGQPRQCGPTSPCPNGFWCHVSTQPSTTVCCSSVKQPCDLPMNEGYGDGKLTRWYFNKQDRQCIRFIFRGLNGNQNNFLTQSECRAACPAFDNPCGSGQPLLVNHKPKICNPNQRCPVPPNPCRDGDPLFDPQTREPVICGGPQECPSGYWCHVSSTPQTTNCCPGTRRPCDLPVELGEGDQQLERWFYDGSSQLCRKFSYKGIKGNSNNFVTRDLCRRVCPEINPCAEGEPLLDENGNRKSCIFGGNTNDCGTSHYCHGGASSLTTVCCPRSPIEPCNQPLNVGQGDERLVRFYYDADDQICHQFDYFGSKGTENSFISKKACEDQCPAHRSYCPHGMPQVDTVSRKPVPCGILKSCQIGYVCHLSIEYKISVCCENPANFCTQPRDPGNCNKTEIRYGYNALTDTCVEYKYSGCGGSLNNFKTMERCTQICCKEYRRKARDLPAIETNTTMFNE
ncbi:hypothetical protein M3Y95_00464700 [Aphelenchoides besseyi]|nr:hypothetical protein M3Y95_00464700 [Aphelenchoides besseyi]